MEKVLSNGFCELSQSEVELLVGGDVKQFAYALGGTLLIASAPIIACAPGGGVFVAVGVAGAGISMIGNCK